MSNTESIWGQPLGGRERHAWHTRQPSLRHGEVPMRAMAPVLLCYWTGAREPSS